MKARTVSTAVTALVFASALGLPSAPLRADEAAADNEEAQLLAILSEETAIATKTKMNGDFVPGIVTVLHGDELEALGFETAWEALSLVPGMMAVRDGAGNPSVFVRGLDFPFNNGNVKLLVNGVALSRESAGINGIALQIPVQEVDRIEVIRGPGSVLYGDFAFMGLVNIVTRQEGARVHARLGEDEALSGGVRVGWRGTKDGFDMALVAAGLVDNTAEVPAPRESKEKRGFGAFTLAKGGFSFTAEGVSRRVDDVTHLPGGVTAGQGHWTVEGRYGRDLATSLHAELRASFLHNRFDAGNSKFKGDVIGTGLDLKWSGWAHHALLFGVDFAAHRISEATMTTPAMGPNPPRTIFVSDQDRRVFGLTIQDTFDVSSRLAVTAGGRFDDYSDIGSRFTPRLALVFRASDEHIVKVQYAEGFRAPTFFELYASGVAQTDLDFEVNRTTELNYVFRIPQTVARATFFYSRISDMVFVFGPGRFDNTKKARAYGFEIEAERQLGERLKAEANFSWTDSEDNRNPQAVTRPVAARATWLANFTALLRATPNTLVGLRWNHVGRRNTSTSAEGYDLVDLTATQNDLFVAGLQLRAGVKNVFDRDPVYLFPRPDGTVTAFDFPGRSYFVQVAFSR
ncbi:MAG TPA: TonB-dependent receptor [Thermoanaerobaculia bacterium]|nr:TonB-dependent receptor [Thermoanaerobaculia bacterium]